MSYEMLNLDFYRDNIYNTQLVNEAKDMRRMPTWDPSYFL